MKLATLLLALPLSLATHTVSADIFNITGDTTLAPVFNRVTESGDLSIFGSAVPYQAQLFTVAASGAYNLNAVADQPASYDTFIHLYSGGFNAATPEVNFLAANDDAVNGSPELGSALNNFNLTAGNTYVLVVNGFGNSDFGAFHGSISGPGAIAAVPEPATTALLAIGGAGLLIVRLRRARN